MKARGQKDGLKAFLFQAVYGDVLSELNACFDLNPHILDDLNFRSQYIPWETVFRDPDGHHPPGHRQLFKYGSPVPFPGKEIGCAQPGRPGSDDRYLLFPFFFYLWNIFISASQVHVGQESMKVLNGQWRFHTFPGTDSFAWMVTYPAADSWKRVCFLEKLKRLTIFSLVD